MPTSSTRSWEQTEQRGESLSPVIFMHTLQHLHVQPSEVIYVGDNVEKDYRGAEKVGIKPVLLVRADTDTLSVPEDVVYVRSLMDLMKYICCPRN